MSTLWKVRFFCTALISSSVNGYMIKIRTNYLLISISFLDHRVRRNRRDSSSGSGRSDSEDEARRSRSSNAVQYRRGR